MGPDNILKLGDPLLYLVSSPVDRREVSGLDKSIALMHKTLLEFRRHYGRGRAISAPQLGIRKRVIAWNVGHPVTLVNPELYDLSEKMIDLWDDCMSFPGLEVRVRRHASCKVRFRDTVWKLHEWSLEGGLSELIQHEVDHLDGILATQRAMDDKAFRWAVA